VKTVRRLTDGPIGKCDATRARAARLNCMTSLPAEMVLVSDEDLQRLAEEKGPTSAEAQALAQLKSSVARICRFTVFELATRI
jgi:hypothetical protein